MMSADTLLSTTQPTLAVHLSHTLLSTTQPTLAVHLSTPVTHFAVHHKANTSSPPVNTPQIE